MDASSARDRGGGNDDSSDVFDGFSDMNVLSTPLPAARLAGTSSSDEKDEGPSKRRSGPDSLSMGSLHVSTPSRNSFQYDTETQNLFGESGTYSTATPVSDETKHVKFDDLSLKSGDSKSSKSSKGSKGPKYSLMIIPADGPDDSICLKYKTATGPTFCVAKNCASSHGGGNDKAELKPNCGYVLKSSNVRLATAFDAPVLNLNNVEDELIDQWRNELKTIEEWSDLATTIKIQSKNTIGKKLGDFDIVVGKDLSQKANAWKSPGLDKKKTLDSDIGMVRAKPPELEAFEDKFTKDPTTGKIKVSLADLIESLQTMSNNIKKLEEFNTNLFTMVEQDHEDLWELSTNFTIKSEEVLNDIGVKPKKLDPDYDTPSLWSGYGILIEKLEGLRKDVEAHAGQVSTTELKDLIDKIQRDMSSVQDQEDKVAELEKKFILLENSQNDHTNLQGKLRILTTRANRTDDFIRQATTHIKNHQREINNILLNGTQQNTQQNNNWNGGFTDFGDMTFSRDRRNANQRPQSTGGGDDGGDDPLDGTTSSNNKCYLEARVAKLEAQVLDLEMRNDTQAIKFGRVHVRSVKELQAWLIIHYPGNDFGELVDFHCALEHIHNQMQAGDLLTNMAKSFKVEIPDLIHAYALKSFEQSMPKYMSTSSSHKPVKLKDSHLPLLTSFEDWDKPDDGFRDKLTEELDDFVTSHTEVLSEHLSEEHPVMYQLAMLALTETQSFTKDLILFADNTYKEYSKSKYSPEHAWHVATMLVKNIILQIWEPRKGLYKTFKQKDLMHMKRKTMFAKLQCLDIMQRLRLKGFRKNPQVYAELVRFNSLHSQHNEIEEMAKKLKAVTDENTELKKKISGLTTTVSNAGNKVDKWKQKIEDLTKLVEGQGRRLKTVEGKI